MMSPMGPPMKHFPWLGLLASHNTINPVFPPLLGYVSLPLLYARAPQAVLLHSV